MRKEHYSGWRESQGGVSAALGGGGVPSSSGVRHSHLEQVASDALRHAKQGTGDSQVAAAEKCRALSSL